MIPPKWDKKRGVYIDQYRDTPYEGTNRMPDNGNEDLTPLEIQAAEDAHQEELYDRWKERDL